MRDDTGLMRDASRVMREGTRVVRYKRRVVRDSARVVRYLIRAVLQGAGSHQGPRSQDIDYLIKEILAESAGCLEDNT
jgi:hypothetical protein